VVQAKEEGHLLSDADERQICFEIHGLILAVHYEARFLKTPGSIDRANKAFEQILERYGATKSQAFKPARKSVSRSITKSHQE
jgi:hypothetical protein